MIAPRAIFTKKNKPAIGKTNVAVKLTMLSALSKT